MAAELPVVPPVAVAMGPAPVINLPPGFQPFPARRRDWPVDKKIIGVFNHKGGVGKSTTTISLGWKLASQGRRVLLVDADPQCNLTGFLVDPGYDLLADELKAQDPLSRFYTAYPLCNIRAALAPLLGSPNLKQELGIPPGCDLLTQIFHVADRNQLLPDQTIHPFTTPPDSLYLLAGHLQLSYEYEDAISQATANPTTSAQAPDIPGAFYHLFQSLIERHNLDYVLVDMSPSASVVNRLLVNSVHQLIVPCSCDFFSHMAVRTLGNILIEWDAWKERLRMQRRDFPNVVYPLPEHKPIFIGVTFQLYTIYNNEPALGFRRWIEAITKAVREELHPLLSCRGLTLPLPQVVQPLASIRNTQSAGTAASKIHVPVYCLERQLVTAASHSHNQQMDVIIHDIENQFNHMAHQVISRWPQLPPAEQLSVTRMQRACTFLQSLSMLPLQHRNAALILNQAQTVYHAVHQQPL